MSINKLILPKENWEKLHQLTMFQESMPAWINQCIGNRAHEYMSDEMYSLLSPVLNDADHFVDEDSAERVVVGCVIGLSSMYLAHSDDNGRDIKLILLATE